jgi:hypothetical protein
MTDIFSVFRFIRRLTLGGNPVAKEEKKKNQNQTQTLSSQGEGPCPTQVRELAYYKWEEACKKAEEAGEPRPNGDGSQYWLEAEQELQTTTSTTTK